MSDVSGQIRLFSVFFGKPDKLTNGKFYCIMNLMPNWKAVYCVIPIIYFLAKDLISAIVIDETNPDLSDL